MKKLIERIIMVLLLLALIGGGAWLYFAVQYKQTELRDEVAAGQYERPIEDKTKREVSPDDWRTIYPNTVSIMIGSTTVQASVADTIAERVQGLSDTPFLPPRVVKLFVFGTSGEQAIWMKNMNYPLDILWADEGGEIVHIEENVSPDTYPKSFSSPIPAWFVIEASAGFVASNTIAIGDKVLLPAR